jgi:DNA-binding NarL/FixJ family response regulator
MQQIVVLLAEDHTIVRQGVRLLVEADGDIKIVGKAKTGREAIRMTGELHPDVVIMDIAMPLLNGIEATRQILKAFPRARILILSAHGDPEYVEQVVEEGECGYLIKQVSGDVLAKAVREVYRGKTFFTASIANRLNHDYQRPPVDVAF